MKKKLLVLAVAAALPMMGAAQADVTVYGKIHASIDYVSPDSYNVIPDVCVSPLADGTCPAVKISPDDVWNVESRASRIGFKGSEDLGGGLKLIWKVESQVDIAGAGNTSGTYWKARNAYIGLAGGWGTFLYGRHDTPMKMSTGKLDLFGDELADYNKTAGFTDIRADDAIAYVSPSWGGLTLAGAVIPDGNYDADGDFAGGYSVAAMWTIGGVYLAAAYEDIDDLNIPLPVGDERYRFGAGWDIGNFFIGGVYENEENSSGDDTDKYQISASFKFGNNKVKGMFADNDLDSDSDLGDLWDDGSAWAVGLDHNFSKRSKMYVQYADSDGALMSSTGGTKGVDGFSFGMVHSF
jgi:predicted porin